MQNRKLKERKKIPLEIFHIEIYQFQASFYAETKQSTIHFAKFMPCPLSWWGSKFNHSKPQKSIQSMENHSTEKFHIFEICQFHPFMLTQNSQQSTQQDLCHDLCHGDAQNWIILSQTNIEIAEDNSNEDISHFLNLSISKPFWCWHWTVNNPLHESTRSMPCLFHDEAQNIIILGQQIFKL